MAAKKMEGDNRERRKVAKEAREEGKSASEVGGTLGASKQHTRAPGNQSHQKNLDLKRQGKVDQIRENTPEASPGARDPETPDRERHPRL